MEHFPEKQRFHEGILDPESFKRNYVLRCYVPSEAMAPFVEHYFISRRRSDFDLAYIGHDVLSQPVASLFIRPGKAFFQGPTTHKRTLRATDSPMYVGAQFKPGGFYPFWQKRVADLAETTVPAISVIPAIKTMLDAPLLQRGDSEILAAIDDVLRSAHPRSDHNIALAGNIVRYVEAGHATSVAAVAKHFAMSERSLQQLFQVCVGVGIKWVIMRARFLEVTKYARRQERPDWTAIATDFGYSDQSHFIKDFKKIVELSPQQYIASIRP